MADTTVVNIKSSGELEGYRGFGGGSRPEGDFAVMENPAQTTQKEFKNLYAIPDSNTLAEWRSVNLKGEDISISIAAPIEGWGAGGGVQVELSPLKSSRLYKWGPISTWH